MGTRTISTKLAVEGEAKYRQAIADINNSLKTMKSELALVEAQYQGNANSMAALQAKGEVLARSHEAQTKKVDELKAALLNAQQAQQTYSAQVEAARARVESAEQALARLKNTEGSSKQEQDALNKELAKYRAELEQAEASQRAAGKGVEDWTRQVNNAQRDVILLDGELQRNRQYIDEARQSVDGCAQSIDGFGREVREAGEDSEDFGQKSGDAIDALASALAAAGVVNSVDEIADALRACVEASLAFETAMAGVRRTVGGTEAELGALSAAFKAMALEIPTTTTELGKIAETAGQLGIARENVESFTRVMAMLSTTTDLTAENAATMLAQFANITGLTDYERLGATVAELGDATATTASKVVEMSQGMAAAASIAGMSETDILAIAAAVGSLGIEAQAGSTAMGTLISNIYKAVETGNEQLKQFASVAGMSAEQFAAAWKTDAAGALDTFIRGLNNVERNGRSAVVILDELGITNVRQTKAILGLANAGDLLTGTLSQASRAWEENATLQEKAGVMYGTTESQVRMMQNALDEVMVSIGDTLTPALGELAEVGTGAFHWAAEFVEMNPWLVQAITGAIAAGSVLLLGITAFTVKTKLAALAATEFGVAVKAMLPGLGIAALITGAAVALGTMAVSAVQASDGAAQLTQQIRENREEYEKTVQGIQAQGRESLSMVAALEKLAATENKTNAEKAALLDLVGKLNEAVPSLSLAYDEQTDSLNLTAEAIQKIVQADIKRQEQEAAASRYANAYQRQLEISNDLTEANAQLRRAEEDLAKAKQTLTENIEAENEELLKLDSWASKCQRTVNELKAAQKENNTEVSEAKEVLNGYQDAVEDTDDVVGGFTVTLTALSDVLGSIQGSYELLSKAQKEVEETGSLSISTLNTLTDKYPELTGYLVETADGYVLTRGALEDYLAAQEAEYDFALNGAKRASVVLINQNSDEKTSIRETTAAIRAKLAALQEEAKAKVSTLNQRYNHRSTLTEAESQEYREATAAVKTYGEALTNLDNASKNVEVFDRAGAMLGRDTARGGGKSGSKSKEKTQAELELEAFETAMEELDHLRALGRISTEDYYRQMGELSDQFLQDEANKKKRWAVEEDLHAYREAEYQRKLDDLTWQRDMEYIGEKEFQERKAALEDQYLTEGTEAWKKAMVERHQWEAAQHDRDLAELDRALEDQEITLEEHMARMAEIQAGETVGSDLWKDIGKRMEEDRAAIFERERSDIEFLRDMGIYDDQKFYTELLRLQGEYLEAGSEAWRAVNVELYAYLEKGRQERQKAAEAAHKEDLAELKSAQDEALKEAKEGYAEEAAALKDHLADQKDALKKGYQEAKEAAKAEYEDRKAAVERELKLEQKRLNGVLEAIDAEVAARRNLREDQDQDAEIDAARKRLAAAQAQRAYARTDEERLEWDREITRLTQALEEAVQNKEDTAFYREKEAQKEQVQDQLQQVKDQADQDKAEAKADYDDTLKRLEDWYEAAVAGAQADYDRRAEELEADYDRHVAKLERDYQADVERLKGELDAYVARLEAEKEARRVSNLDTVAPAAGAAAAGVDLGAILGLFHAAQAGVSNAYSASYGAVDNRKSASLSVNNYSAPLTEGQLMNLLRKVLEQMGR